MRIGDTVLELCRIKCVGPPKVHVVHLLIRRSKNHGVRFLFYPHGKWMTAAGRPFLRLPTKKTVKDPFAEFIQGTSLEIYVDDVLQNDLTLKVDDYALEQEIEPADEEMVSPTHGKLTTIGFTRSMCGWTPVAGTQYRRKSDQPGCRDDDLSSKCTFNLILEMHNAQITKCMTTVPILTYPSAPAAAA